jgi:hypothetical protein
MVPEIISLPLMGRVQVPNYKVIGEHVSTTWRKIRVNVVRK